MATIKFKFADSNIEYCLSDLNKGETLYIDSEIIVDVYGDVGAWGDDYHNKVSCLVGAAKVSAEQKYLKNRAENLIISELIRVRDELNEVSK